jgi:hypothetical protein
MFTMMRSLLFVLCLVIFSETKGQEVLVFEGKYTGENLYFQNPYATRETFCTDSVTVNGKKAVSELNSTAFEVRLTDCGLKPYDPLVVKVYHKAGCAPKILPAFVHHRSYVRIPSISFDSSGVLSWTIDNDSLLDKVVFTVEQYKWNKWVKSGEVEQKDMRQTRFSFKPVLHSGENRFRVKYVDYSGKPYLSNATQIVSTTHAVTFKIVRPDNKVVFSSKTQFEVYDQNGNLIDKGYGTEVFFPKKTKSGYYLNYDNRTEEVWFNQ